MAAAAQDDDEMITAINVTPLVDIVLVLLIILMVTASYVVVQGDPAGAAQGGDRRDHAGPRCRCRSTKTARLYLDGGADRRRPGCGPRCGRRTPRIPRRAR